VVLAGGVSSRFGGDKPLALYGGEPMVRRVCRVLGQVVDEVYVSSKGLERTKNILSLVSDLAKDAFTDDESLGCRGPIAGIGTASIKTDSDFLLTAAADNIRLDAEVLSRFLSRCLDSDATSASIVWGNGIVESLIQFHETSYVRSAARRVCGQKIGVRRATDLLRGSPKLLLVRAESLTTDATVLADADTKEDLAVRRPVWKLAGDVAEDILFEWGSCQGGGPFWNALDLANAGDYRSACLSYEEEANLYEHRGVHLLASHCFSDAYHMAVRAGLGAKARALREASRGHFPANDS